MIAEIFLYGFISAFGWWSANHYIIEPHLDGKPVAFEQTAKEQQRCTAWEEVKNPDGTISRTRTCEKITP